MKQKATPAGGQGFAPIIILVLIVLVVVGYWGYKNWAKLHVVAPPTPTASTSPKIAFYSSNQFSFSLPQGWTTTNPNLSNSTFDSGGPDLSDMMRISVVDTRQDYNGLECMSPTKKVIRKIDNQSITISYFSGIDGGMCSNPGARFISFVVAKNYLVSYIYDQANTKNAEVVFDQILSTFKFTNSTPSNITKDQAVQLVWSLPEVKAYLVTVPNGIVEFDHESDDKTLWVVHVYEMKDDHTATFNWFEVNKTSGKINKEF